MSDIIPPLNEAELCWIKKYLRDIEKAVSSFIAADGNRGQVGELPREKPF